MSAIGWRARRNWGLALALALTACAGTPVAPPVDKPPPRKPTASATPGGQAGTPTPGATPGGGTPGPGTPGATATPTSGGTVAPGGATPTPGPAATPAVSFGLPAAQEAIAVRAGGKLLAIAQVGFAQNRGKLAVDGVTGLSGGGLPVGVLSNNGGGVLSNNGAGLLSNNGGGLISDLGSSLVSNNGGSVIANNGGSVIANNGGSVIANNGAGYRLMQAAPTPTPEPRPVVSLAPVAPELLFADRRWPDGERMLLFVHDIKDTDAKFRRVNLRPDGSVAEEVRFETLARWPSGAAKQADYHITNLYPDGALRAIQAYRYEPDEAGKTLRIAMKPGESRVREPATGVAVTFQAFEVDLPAKKGNFEYRYTHLGATETGTLVDVAALPNGQVPLTYDDPLGFYDGESTLKDARGNLVFTKRQRHEGAAVKRTYDLQGGITAELTRSSDTTYEGELRVDGAKAAAMTLSSKIDGSVLIKLVFPEAPDKPLELGFGVADGEPAPTPTPTPSPASVGLLAGDVAAGYIDGDGAAARFKDLSEIARSVRDPDKLYVADTGNHRIRTIKATSGLWKVGTLAGTGARGGADGAGAAATFDFPVGLAVAPGPDGGETVFVSDQGSHRVRAIAVAADGAATVETLAGTGSAGFADAAGLAAAFDNPGGLAYDPAGRLLIADVRNHRVRALDLNDPTHPVTTVLGGAAGFVDGPAATARVKEPAALAIDAQRRLYVADRGNLRLRRVDLGAAGAPVTTVAGSGDPLKAFRDGPALEGGFNPPRVLALDAGGRLYTGYFDVRALTPAGQLLTVAGGILAGQTGGPVQSALFTDIYGLAVGPSGILVVADGNRLRGIVPAPGKDLVP